MLFVHWDLGHGGLRDEALALQLPLLLLPQQLADHLPDDRGVIRKVAHHVGTAFDFLIEPLEWVDLQILRQCRSRKWRSTSTSR